MFLHEQIHWFFGGKNSKKTDQFVNAMKKHFPSVPVGLENGGARDMYATYLHLGVCYYELMALSRYLGEEHAKTIFETGDIYTWVRKQILENQSMIEKELKNQGLVL